MSYPNRLGEFLVPQEDPNWVPKIRYIERRPVQLRHSLDPWGIERQRVVWMQEEAAWKQIVPLQREYVAVEAQMRRDAEEFNAILAQLESETNKKVGSPIHTYGSMALAVVPGFGWAAGLWNVVSQLFAFIGGSKKKKKIERLIQRLESLQARLHAAQAKLELIQRQVAELVQVTERVKAEQRAVTEQVQQAVTIEAGRRRAAEREAAARHRELARQVARTSVYSATRKDDL